MMKKIVYIIICLWLVVSCAKQSRPVVYHPKLVDIDSLLQHESLQWKNLNRGEEIMDVYEYEGALFIQDTTPRSGNYYYNGQTKMFYKYRRILSPLDEEFEEKGMLNKTSQPLFLLKHFSTDSLKTEADSMYYSLLKSESLVKDFIVRKGIRSISLINDYVGNDSNIRTVSAYYDELGDKSMQARAHALLAFYQRASNTTEAVREFLIAARFAKEVRDDELLAYIYRILGHTYFWRDAYQKADSIYTLAEPLAIAQKDTMLWMESIKFKLGVEMKMGLRRAWTADEAHFQALRRMSQGLELAQAYGNKEYIGDFALLLGEEYLDRVKGNDGYLEKALFYAKKAESLVFNGNVYKLLGKVYAEMGKTDSTAFYLAKIYGDDWQKKGPIDLWMKVVKDLDAQELVAVETELEKEWQKEQYESFLLRNKYVLIGAILTGGILLLLLHVYHRRRYRKQSERLSGQLHKSRSLYALLQKGLNAKEEEIRRLQDELNSRSLNESVKQNLMEELTVANENRDVLAQEVLIQTPAYNKVQLIMNDFRWKEESDHQLNEHDWQELIDGVNACYNKVLARMIDQYLLDVRELHICCLLLLDVPVVHIAHLIGYTRPIIYKTEQKILQKMGRTYEKGYLRKLLKTI